MPRGASGLRLYRLALEGSKLPRRKCERLRESADFDRVRSVGRSWTSPLVILRVAKASHETVRLGIVTTKRLGKAVQRNRARRLIREAMRRLCPRLQAGWDVVIIARPRVLEASAPQVQSVLEDLLQRAELFASPPEADRPSPGGLLL